jgi:hypothetical protein
MNIKGRGYSFVGTVVPFIGSTESRNDRLTRVCFGLRAVLPQARSPAVRPALVASSAMKVTLSRKGAENQTRGRKLHRTGAKARIARARKSRADLERELKACRRESSTHVSALPRRRWNILPPRCASSRTRQFNRCWTWWAEHAARLCDASNARIWRLEDNLHRLVASYGESSATMDDREGLPADRDTATGRVACDRRTIHVHDIAAEDREYPVGSRLVKNEAHHACDAVVEKGPPLE